MKGKLKKIGEEWVVTYDTFQNDHSYPFPAYKIIPLHPDDVKEIEEDSKIFDNIEARIAAYPDVEFEVVKEYTDSHTNQVQKYAKLIKTGYPELEGTMNLCNDITKKRTGKMTEEEWQEAERAQTSTKTAMTSIEWLIEELDELIPYEGITTSQVFTDVLAKAKEMHKQEIIDAWEMGRFNIDAVGLGEEYYQETFVSKGSDELEQVVNDYDDDPTWIDDEVELPQQEISDEMDKPKLHEAKFEFYQEANCINNEDEALEIRCVSDLGIDNAEGCFYILKTDSWSIDNVGELQELFDRLHKTLFPKQIKKD